MAETKNISEVRLLNVPLENDYLHTLYFSSKTAQYNYFVGRTVRSHDSFSYIRKDKIIRYDKDYDDLLGCNYLMYKNKAYSDKWFYAFITKIEYVNDGVSYIYFETDVIQTWMFDYTVKSSFVEREHVSDDSIGLHTFPEGLETGPYKCNSVNKQKDLLYYSYIMACTVDLNDEDGILQSQKYNGVGGAVYNGLYSGIRYYALNTTELNRAIKALAEAGKSDAITSIFVAPSMMFDSKLPKDGTYPIVETSADESKIGWTGNALGVDYVQNKKPVKIDGYTPKNKKLLTYPFCYMLMSNNSGASAVYKYELFKNPDDDSVCPFDIRGTVTPGFSIRLVPQYYNGADRNNEEGLNLGKYPICGWNTDVYTNWLTQNGINIGISLVTSAAQIIGGAVALAGSGVSAGASGVVGAGALISGITSVSNTLAEVNKQSFAPPQAEGNVNSGDITFASGDLTFTAYQMTIKKEYAQIIDNFFSMFGYKVNRVKVPEKNHRKNYWYTKTIDVNIDGAIPMEDMKKIKECYNRGITFWKNSSNIQNYSIDNSIV